MFAYSRLLEIELKSAPGLCYLEAKPYFELIKVEPMNRKQKIIKKTAKRAKARLNKHTAPTIKKYISKGDRAKELAREQAELAAKANAAKNDAETNSSQADSSQESVQPQATEQTNTESENQA